MFSFLSSALSNWPLPSYYAGAISSALQKRLIQYILKRVLGHLIKDGDVKLDQIESGIVSGRVEIRNVHLDNEFFDKLLESTPLRLAYGLVGSISIQIPWSNISAGELIIEVTGIDASFVIDSCKNAKRREQGLQQSLSQSIFYAAQEVFEDDPEGRELEESVASLASSEYDATQGNQAPAGYIVGIVNNLLARLVASLSNINVKISNQSSSQARDNSGDLVLRLNRVRVTPDTTRESADYARDCHISGISLWLDDKSTSNSTENATRSDSEDDSEDNGDQIQPSMYASFATAQSLYASAVEGADTLPQMATQRAQLERGLQKILQIPGEAVQANVAITTASVQGIEVDVSLTVEMTAVLLTPTTLSCFLRFLQEAGAAVSSSGKDDAVSERNAALFNLSAAVHCRGLHLLNIYEFPDSLSASNYAVYRQSIETFWARPSRQGSSIGHHRLRIQDISAKSSLRMGTTQSEFQIKDLALYEILSQSLAEHIKVPHILPLLLFDQNLVSLATGESVHQVSSIDWRLAPEKTKLSIYRKTDFSEHGWKVKQRHQRSSSSSSSTVEESSCIAVKRDVDDHMQVSAHPVHLFLDNSGIDRMLPYLNYIASNSYDKHSRYVDDVLSASYDTIQARSLDEDEEAMDVSGEGGNKFDFHFQCPLMRLETRMASQQVASKDDSIRLLGCNVRSGIVVLDFASISISTAVQPSELKRNVRFGGEVAQESSQKLTVDSFKVYHADQGAVFASIFASIGALRDDEEGHQAALLPTVSVGNRAECLLPSMNATLSKPLLDQLQLFADDLSLWANNVREWREQSDAENTTEALKILGSRFFGTKQSYSTLSSSSASTDIVRVISKAPPIFTLELQQLEITLQLQGSNNRNSSIVVACASDINMHHDAKFASNAKQTTITVASLSVTTDDGDGNQRNLLERTLRPSLMHSNPALFSLKFISTEEPDTSFKSSQMDILAEGFTLTYFGDDALLRELALFFKSPEGAFDHVVPNEVTRIGVRVKDISLLIAPLDCQARATLVISDALMRTKLISDYPRTTLRLTVDDLYLLSGEKIQEKTEHVLQSRRVLDLWTSLGLAKIANVKEMKSLVILSRLTRPEVDVKVTRLAVEVLACADSMNAVQMISSKLMPTQPPKAKSTARERQASGQSDAGDLLTSFDEDAFRTEAVTASTPDLLEDDVPENPDFLHQEAQWRADFETDDEVLDEGDEENYRVHNRDAKVILQNDIVTVRLLDKKRGIDPTEKYFSEPNLTVVDVRNGADRHASNFRFRLSDCDVTVRLFAGYDCQSSRLAIEEEAKKVRKRLQKIKQMLDEGQTPDDSVEEAAATLFDSIHVALPNGKAAGDLDPSALIRVVDEELDDQSETASSASTWKQFVPGRPSNAGGRASPVHKRRRSKLARSRDSFIDIVLKGLRVDFDSFVPESDLASRTKVRIAKVRILDNIKTSTWQTFLTEMAPHRLKSGMPYPNDMVRFELSQIRSASTEVRCRASIAPLRLHVDQDALDFLKKFFSFKAVADNGNGLAETQFPATPSNLPFIQHAEVYAIRLKLDYKPKRVDYRLLRQGKTIEMMNFFNFEGSEIVLRHITLRGVSGWATLFDMLNDLWTPDVRSNQLADVLSGITPIRSLVNVGTGVADLILLPIEQYQRDGRLSRGLREGAKRFAKTTALEAARLGAQLATGTQVILEQAENVLIGASGSSRATAASKARQSNSSDQEYGVVVDADVNSGDDLEQDDGSNPEAQFSRYAKQPADIRQALGEAQKGLQRGFNQAAQTILAVPMEVYERRAGEGGSRPVVRAVPIAVLRSAAGATEAVSKTLQGVHRELAGVHLAEEEGKYKQRREK